MQQRTAKLLIFQEWVPGNSLSSRLRTYGAFSDAMTRRYVTQVLAGLAYLHSHGVVHMDIKCENLLVSANNSECSVCMTNSSPATATTSASLMMVLLQRSSLSLVMCACVSTSIYAQLGQGGVVKLADFGTAGSIDDAARTGRLGSPLFMAPEVMLHRHYSPKADIWSVGGAVLQMATLKAPWQERGFRTPVQLAKHMAQCDQSSPPLIAPHLSPELQQFLCR